MSKSFTFRVMLVTALFTLLIVSLLACSTAKETSAPVATTVTYESDVKQIIANNCLTCHGETSPTMAEYDLDIEGYKAQMKGPRLDSYENLIVVVKGTDTGALMRRLDDGTNREDGKPGNMYVNLGKTDEERAQNLETIKKWVGSWSLKKVDEITEEELKAITALEK